MGVLFFPSSIGGFDSLYLLQEKEDGNPVLFSFSNIFCFYRLNGRSNRNPKSNMLKYNCKEHQT